jgi:hypothetical protein
MKKDILNHLIYFLIYFTFITLINKLFSFSYWTLFVGGLVGLVLPNLDHLLYCFVFKPFELTSIRIKALVTEKRFKEAVVFLYTTKDERKDLIFHTLNFQIIFAILAFWVVSSSGNLFGKGLVLGFSLSEAIYVYKNSIDKKTFWIMALILLVLGVMM